ncbi:MAG: hypothetical protein KAS32_01190 [Candidatus Peribacteraceae bacterium]|nr:hypothetical protein [Candidatus Peribacteraceae bacterium]
MSSKTEAQQVFDTVLTLQYGEIMELTFPLDAAADSFRSALYRERKNWAISTGSKDQISITRDYTSFPFKLEIVKIPGMMGAVIKRSDGTVKDFTFKEKEEPPVYIAPIIAKTELDRQKDLMRADGMSEEEIEEYFREDIE